MAPPPEADGQAVELVVELAQQLLLGGNKNAASIKEAARSTKLVAGARNHRESNSLIVAILLNVS